MSGREPFLKKYEFGHSRGYFVIHDTKRYDSKALAGAAHQHLGPESTALSAQTFSGGEKTVARVLESLGFEVTTPARNAERSIPYGRGQLYHRQRDIHQLFVGQEQGGLSTPSDAPFVSLFTGESGEQFGYRDGWRDDGSFAYTGEGQHRDREFVRGNRSIRDHLANGKDLLLFQTTSQSGQYRFVGTFACAGWEVARAPDLEGNERRAIIFLTPVETRGDEEESPPTELLGRPIDELRRLAYGAAEASKDQGPASDARRTYYRRSATVKAYVLRRANGVCKCCSEPAPFLRADGSPYLEPHHTLRLADGGPDNPRWVAAICPTCHRRIHHGKDGEQRNNDLMNRLSTIEAD